MGMRTWFRPAAAISEKSSSVMNDSQCSLSAASAVSLSCSDVNVYSSTILSFSVLSNSDGVIHDSRRSH